jgi:hypothetical protein
MDHHDKDFDSRRGHEKPQVSRVPADGPMRLFPPVWQQLHPAILNSGSNHHSNVASY